MDKMEAQEHIIKKSSHFNIPITNSTTSSPIQQYDVHRIRYYFKEIDISKRNKSAKGKSSNIPKKMNFLRI